MPPHMSWRTSRIHVCHNAFMYALETHTATHCNTLQHTATGVLPSLIHVCRDARRSFMYAVTHSSIPWWHTLQHAATHCNTLQQVYYSLEPVQIGSMDEDDDAHCNTLQLTATHCNTPQHTATHCNSLQHTATGVSLAEAGADWEYGWGWLCLQHHFWVGRNGVASFDNSACRHHVLCARPVSILSINIYLNLWNIESLHIYM